MKKLSFFIALFVSLASYSQIEFFETEKTEVIGHVEFVYLEKVGENTYNFYYKNMNDPIQDYVFFSFNDVNDDFNMLHQFLAKGFEENPRDGYKIKANGNVVLFKYERQRDNEVKMRIKQYVSRDPDVTTVSKFMTLEELNKLFKK